MKFGVDVSDCQGVIDWAKVKAAGVEFAILRTVKKSGAVDKYLLQNIKGCNAQGIKLGFYKYSYAMTTGAAQEEAKAVVKALTSCGIQPSKDYCIWFDCEEDSQINLGKKALYSIYDCFKEVIINSGYSCGLYMGKYDYEHLSDFSDLTDYVWIARYPDTTSRTLKSLPNEKYKPSARGNNILYGWQFSSKGSVPGISGNVDLDVIYNEIEIKDKPIEYYPVPCFTLIQSLDNIGVDSSFKHRKAIAEKNGIVDYSGTLAQNNKMLELLNSGLLIK